MFVADILGIVYSEGADRGPWYTLDRFPLKLNATFSVGLNSPVNSGRILMSFVGRCWFSPESLLIC